MAWQDNYTPEEVARIIAETDGAALNPGFDAAAHVAAVWGTNSGTNPPTGSTAPVSGEVSPMVIENFGQWRLSKFPDGSYMVEDKVGGGGSHVIKDYGPTIWRSGDIVAADFFNGNKAVVFSGGHVWYVDSNWTKAPMGPNGRDTENLSSSEISTYFYTDNPPTAYQSPMDTPVTPAPPPYQPPVPADTIRANIPSANEGDILTFTVTTSKGPNTYVTFQVSGVQASDLESNASVSQSTMSGSAMVAPGGQAFISIPIKADNLTEGDEILTVTLSDGGQADSVLIRDTSKTQQQVASYNVTASQGQVTEGQSANFLIQGVGVTPGTSVPYQITGVSPTDIVGGKISGTLSLSSAGQATLSVPIAFDNLVEGDEVMTLGVAGKTATVRIQDASNKVPTYAVSSVTSAVDEGSIASFTVSTTNVTAGSFVPYEITGVSADDLLLGELTGFVSIGATGVGTLQLEISADAITEGVETLVLNVEGKSGSVIINDTSKGTSTYVVTGLTSTVNEGEIANFTVQASNTAAGSSVPYKITGVSAADLTNKSLEGIATINSAGVGRIQLQIENDNLLEGDETLTVVIGDASASMKIIDTSNPQKAFEQTNTLANETFVAPAGTTLFQVAARLDEVSVRSTDGGKTWLVTSKDTGADTVVGYKRIKLEDQSIALDFTPGDASYKSVMLIGAAFGKDFVPGYFGAGISLFDSGSTMQDASKLIADIKLIEQVIGDESNSAWVKHIYKNVVGAEPDLLTEAVFINFLESGAYSRGDLLAAAADLPLLESQVNMTGYQTNGMVYSSFI